MEYRKKKSTTINAAEIISLHLQLDTEADLGESAGFDSGEGGC